MGEIYKEREAPSKENLTEIEQFCFRQRGCNKIKFRSEFCAGCWTSWTSRSLKQMQIENETDRTFCPAPTGICSWCRAVLTKNMHQCKIWCWKNFCRGLGPLDPPPPFAENVTSSTDSKSGAGRLSRTYSCEH